MTANEARRLILTARCAVVYFTKKDGTTRRMVCHVPADNDRRALSRNPHHLLVWDVEKGAVRTINLATVEAVKPVAIKRPAPAPAPDRAPETRPGQAFARQMLATMSSADISALFDNRA